VKRKKTKDNKKTIQADLIKKPEVLKNPVGKNIETS